MSDEMTGDAPKRNICLRFLAWLWGDSLGRRALILLGGLVVLVMMAYAEEDWRGAHAWHAYQDAAAARGLALDYKSYIPMPVPYSDNFAEAPFLGTFTQPGQLRLATDLYSQADNNIDETPPKAERGRRRLTDLVAWQKAAEALQTGLLKREQRFSTGITNREALAAAAAVVLKGMEPNADVYAAIREAGSRPLSRFAVNYNVENPWSTPLPHLAKVKQMGQRLALRACAELAAGQGDEAAADVKAVFALADSIKGEPTWISYVVRVGTAEIGLQPVWEGLAEHRWNDAQLREMQTQFLSNNFVGDIELPMNAERAMGTYLADYARKHGLREFAGMISMPVANQSDPALDLLGAVGHFVPDGWYDFEKVNYNGFFDMMMNGVFDPKAKTVSPARWMNNAAALAVSEGRLGPDTLVKHRLLAALMLPSLGGTAHRAAEGQVAVEEAGLACALERYRLGNGAFPETLEALVPRFITNAPNDVITGKPYHYRRTDDGRFILYSVGWNEKDDGGVPGDTLFDRDKGDWVWEYPSQ